MTNGCDELTTSQPETQTQYRLCLLLLGFDTQSNEAYLHVAIINAELNEPVLVKTDVCLNIAKWIK